MSNSSFGKVVLGFLGGAAVGAALGVLLAPAKGTVTRRRIVKTTRDIRNNVTDKLEDLVESAEEIIDEIKDTASEFVHGKEEEPKARKTR
ncbi:YtxH domain-containing protein [Paludibacter sp. 221]|uniref:YtxH domain-containing protein n=1 Tax=Paludibacter sp. 221 TaxID=2302939 RepID=UPI0013D43D8A|nr:YtxH domain-containing protein [Paludibacter sp. 221]NDV47000.1 YtxH domain-containing protein [Paludibacter sp. 221]